MADHLRLDGTGLSQALGRIPSGLYILTVCHGERSTGMLASWVQQAGFEPPMLTVAVKRDRYVSDWIEASGQFTLNQIPTGSKSLIRHFGRGFDPDASAFEGLTLRNDAQGGPVLAAAMAFLDLKVAGQVVSGDHRIFLAQIIAGGLLEPEAEALVHIRSNGLHY